MKNKKGFTLVEIIVSMALISVVLIFLFQILTIMKGDDVTSNKAALSKSLASKLNVNLQNAIMNTSITNIEQCSSLAERCYNITFSTNDILTLELYDEKKIVSLFKYNDETKEVSLYESYQLDLEDNYLSDLRIYSVSAIKSTGYDIPYDSILKISFSILDDTCKEYKIEAFYPFDSATHTNLTNLNITKSNTKSSCD